MPLLDTSEPLMVVIISGVITYYVIDIVSKAREWLRSLSNRFAARIRLRRLVVTLALAFLIYIGTSMVAHVLLAPSHEVAVAAPAEPSACPPH